VKNEELRKARGQKSRKQRSDNTIRVYLAIAKEPSSFSELQKKTKLSPPVLSSHLKFLTENLAIYPDTIKRHEARNSQEIGKSVYRATVDEIPRMLNEALSALFILSEPFEDKELNRKLVKYKDEIAKAIYHHIKTLEKKRALEVALERETLREERKKELPRKKPEFNWTDEGWKES